MTEGYWKNMVGWFDFPDVYDAAVDQGNDGDVFIEVGVFLGESIVYLAERIEKSGKDIKVVGVDIFSHAKGVCRHIKRNKKLKNDPYWRKTRDDLLSGETTPMVVCQHGINESGQADRISLVQSDSAAYAASLEDESVNFVFIDGAHSCPGCFRDITAFWGKVKSGGVLAGHDYNRDVCMGVVGAVDVFFKVDRGMRVNVIQPRAVGQRGNIYGASWWVDKP